MAPKRATCGALVRPPVSPKQRIQLGLHCVLGAPKAAICLYTHPFRYSRHVGAGRGPLLADPPTPLGLRPSAYGPLVPGNSGGCLEGRRTRASVAPTSEKPLLTVLRTGSVIWVESRVRAGKGRPHGLIPLRRIEAPAAAERPLLSLGGRGTLLRDHDRRELNAGGEPTPRIACRLFHESEDLLHRRQVRKDQRHLRQAVQHFRARIGDGDGASAQGECRLTERLNRELHDVGGDGGDAVRDRLEVHLDDGIARGRSPAVEARIGHVAVDLHDGRHDDGQVRPAAADGLGGAQRLDGTEGENHYSALGPEEFLEVFGREVRLELGEVDAALVEGLELGDLFACRFGGCVFNGGIAPFTMVHAQGGPSLGRRAERVSVHDPAPGPRGRQGRRLAPMTTARYVITRSVNDMAARPRHGRAWRVLGWLDVRDGAAAKAAAALLALDTRGERPIDLHLDSPDR